MEQSKWVDQIVGLQQPDGGWGHFHSLGGPTKQMPMTTEQAIRRLLALGLTRRDAPLQRALAYLHGVLTKEIVPPDRREKALHWDCFEAMMAAAWIRLLDPQDAQALQTARFWADIVGEAFADGTFDAPQYAHAYRRRIPKLYTSERLIASEQFYMVTLLVDMLPPGVEKAYITHLLQHPTGIYYVYDCRIDSVPEVFASRQTVRYLAALQCLSPYACAADMLRFAAEWLLQHRQPDGIWDLGPGARDGIHLPLSDSWRSAGVRQRDCTLWVGRVLQGLGHGTQKESGHR